LAWEEFLTIYIPLVRSLVHRFGLQSSDGDDVIQEVLTKVSQHIGSWKRQRERGSFRSWLATIARNETMMLFRVLKKKPRTNIEFDDWRNTTPEVQDETYCTESKIRQITQIAKSIRSSFSAKTWRAFWLSTVEMRSIEETSKLLGVPKGHVYVARSRVIKKIRSKFQNSEFHIPVNESI